MLAITKSIKPPKCNVHQHCNLVDWDTQKKSYIPSNFCNQRQFTIKVVGSGKFDVSFEIDFEIGHFLAIDVGLITEIRCDKRSGYNVLAWVLAIIFVSGHGFHIFVKNFGSIFLVFTNLIFMWSIRGATSINFHSLSLYREKEELYFCSQYLTSTRVSKYLY